MPSRPAGGPTIGQRVERAVDDERIETILHREQQGSLDAPRSGWTEYGTVGALPARPLDGWEELVVFTTDHVYRWVETGFGRGPTVVPRSPETVMRTPSFPAD